MPQARESPQQFAWKDLGMKNISKEGPIPTVMFTTRISHFPRHRGLETVSSRDTRILCVDECTGQTILASHPACQAHCLIQRARKPQPEIRSAPSGQCPNALVRLSTPYCTSSIYPAAYPPAFVCLILNCQISSLYLFHSHFEAMIDWLTNSNRWNRAKSAVIMRSLELNPPLIPSRSRCRGHVVIIIIIIINLLSILLLLLLLLLLLVVVYHDYYHAPGNKG